MGVGQQNTNRQQDNGNEDWDALKGDVALIEAWEADRWGNLTYRQSGRNFNPVMAMAAELTVVQAQHRVELGALDPERVVTPGVFVDRVVHIPYGAPRLW